MLNDFKIVFLLIIILNYTITSIIKLFIIYTVFFCYVISKYKWLWIFCPYWMYKTLDLCLF